eukprot:5257571-Alexandrium_andersonii.AAC.1
MIRFCRKDRAYNSEQVRLTLCIEKTGVRRPVLEALVKLGGAPKFGRAPSSFLARGLRKWLEVLAGK